MTFEDARVYLTGLIQAAIPGYTDPAILIEYENLPVDTKEAEYYMCVEFKALSGDQISLGDVGQRTIRQYGQAILLVYTREGLGTKKANTALQYFGSALEFKAASKLVTQSYAFVDSKDVTGWSTRAVIVPFDFDRLA